MRFIYTKASNVIPIVFISLCFAVCIGCERQNAPVKSVSVTENDCREFIKRVSPNSVRAKLSDIKLLDFSYNPKITGAEFSVLSETPNVLELNCHYTINLDDSFATSLRYMPSIRTLILFYTLVTEQSIDEIAKLKDLEMFRIGYAFDKHSPPETFTMHFPFTDATLEKLKACKNLKHLYIGEQCTITDDGLRHLESYKKLEYLGLVTPNITPAGIDFLKTLTRIKHIDIFLPARDRDNVVLIKQTGKYGTEIFYQQKGLRKQ
jgi:hypothetical protein